MSQGSFGLEWILLVWILDRDPSKIGEFVDRSLAAKPAISGVFHASERHLSFVMDRRTVDMANA
jgi:hypothetical protein